MGVLNSTFGDEKENVTFYNQQQRQLEESPGSPGTKILRYV